MDQKRLHVVRAIHDTLHDGDNPCGEFFGWAEGQSGVPRAKLFLGLVVVTAVYLARPDPGTVLLGNLIGFLYPAYMTIAVLLQPAEAGRPPRPTSVAAHRRQQQQLQEQQREQKRRAARWYVYWMVFAASLMAHHTLGRLLDLVPFYGLIRVAVFVWCSAPVSTNGADFVLAMVVRRYFAHRFAVPADADDSDNEAEPSDRGSERSSAD